jgi:hypothetical protein
MTIRSKAGHVLATSQDPDARSVAAHVLARDEVPPVTKTEAELRRLLAKIDGKEGQTERANAIRAQLETFGS